MRHKTMLLSTKQRVSLLAILAVLTILVVAAWRRGDGRQAVDGVVTLDGQPLADAAISFQPAPGNPGGTSGAATDRGGRFTVSALKGLMPGRYVVVIQKWKGTGQTFKDQRTGDIHEITAPIPFHEAEKLETIVTTKGPNRFEFRLTSSK